MSTPELIAERLTLRPFRDADAADYTRMCRDQEVLKWCPGVPYNYTEQLARKYFASTGQEADTFSKFSWAVDASGLLAGRVSLSLLSETAGEIGFFSSPAARGRGLMTEALRVVLAFGFDPQGLGLDSIRWTAVAGNSASLAVARKLGFEEFAFVENGTPGRPDTDGMPTRLDAMTATLTREDWAFLGMDIV